MAWLRMMLVVFGCKLQPVIRSMDFAISEIVLGTKFNSIFVTITLRSEFLNET